MCQLVTYDILSKDKKISLQRSHQKSPPPMVSLGASTKSFKAPLKATKVRAPWKLLSAHESSSLNLVVFDVLWSKNHLEICHVVAFLNLCVWCLIQQKTTSYPGYYIYLYHNFWYTNSSHGETSLPLSPLCRRLLAATSPGSVACLHGAIAKKHPSWEIHPGRLLVGGWTNPSEK